MCLMVFVCKPAFHKTNAWCHESSSFICCKEAQICKVLLLPLCSFNLGACLFYASLAALTCLWSLALTSLGALTWLQSHWQPYLVSDLLHWPLWQSKCLGYGLSASLPLGMASMTASPWLWTLVLDCFFGISDSLTVSYFLSIAMASPGSLVFGMVIAYVAALT
jgi:hypothetical protein